MIHIRIKVKDRHVTIDVDGHANAAPKGEDVVCAGVSTLVLTLVEALVRVGAQDYKCDLRGGKAHIECRQTKVTKPVLNTIVCGMDLLAATYPQYVEVCI